MDGIAELLGIMGKDIWQRQLKAAYLCQHASYGLIVRLLHALMALVQTQGLQDSQMEMRPAS